MAAARRSLLLATAFPLLLLGVLRFNAAGAAPINPHAAAAATCKGGSVGAAAAGNSTCVLEGVNPADVVPQTLLGTTDGNKPAEGGSIETVAGPTDSELPTHMGQQTASGLNNEGSGDGEAPPRSIPEKIVDAAAVVLEFVLTALAVHEVLQLWMRLKKWLWPESLPAAPEITWQDFKLHLLGTGEVQRIVVVDDTLARVQLCRPISIPLADASIPDTADSDSDSEPELQTEESSMSKSKLSNLSKAPAAADMPGSGSAALPASASPRDTVSSCTSGNLQVEEQPDDKSWELSYLLDGTDLTAASPTASRPPSTVMRAVFALLQGWLRLSALAAHARDNFWRLLLSPFRAAFRLVWRSGATIFNLPKLIGEACAAATRFVRGDRGTAAAAAAELGAPSDVYQFSISGVEGFEARLDAAQAALGVKPRKFVRVQYVHEARARKVSGRA